MSEKAKKPQTRPLWAEPLEERLPVSSSAAGVLFGLGLADDPPTAYEAPQTNSSPLPDLTPDFFASNPLDIQLDTTAVDQVYSDESLLDTISASSDDSFGLTPLTLDGTLDDTTRDAHREFGDELLLHQISTLDFNSISPEAPFRTRDGVTFDQSVQNDFWNDLGRLDTKTESGGVPRDSGAIKPLEQCACEHEHDDHERDDEGDNGRSGGSGGNGGSGGSGGSGGTSWSLTGVYYKQISGGLKIHASPPPGNGPSGYAHSGGAVFPEKETPSQTVVPKSFEITVSIVNPSSETMRVYFGYNDIVNWAYPNSGAMHTQDNVKNDNNGTIAIPAYVDVPAGSTSATVTATITDVKAGDNWVFYAGWSSNGAIAKTWSTQLTVWRTLNVECDVMNYPGASISPKSPAGYLDGFVMSELKRACILIKEYEPNNIPVLIGSNPMTATEYDAITGDETVSGVGRDSPVTTDEFWTVRIVMASKANQSLINRWNGNNPSGLFQPGSNTIVIFNERLADIVSQNQTLLDTGIRCTILHEIGHALIDKNHQLAGIMKENYGPNDNYYLLDDIKKIQKKSKVNI